MSSEIKFRAFDKQKNRMFEVYGIGKDFVTENTLDGVDEGTNCFSGKYFRERIEIMQFTGLKDKNGIDIYDGDIMKDRFGAISKVLYVAEYGGYRQLSKIGYSPLNQAEIISSNDIIIGTIYENPELLK